MSANERNNNNPSLLIDRSTEQNVMTPRLLITTTIRTYFQSEEQNINNNNGCVDAIKLDGIVRMLSLNPNGCKPCNELKSNMLSQVIKKLSIDIIMMQETNTKWTTRNISKIKYNVKTIDRESVIVTADSNEWEVSKSDYLSGGVCSIFFRKCSSFIE